MPMTEKDIRLLIRAELQNPTAFKQTAELVDKITESLDAQSKAARTGEASIEVLASTIDDLRKAGERLAANQGLIENFQRLETRITAQAASVEAAKKKFDEYAAKLNAQSEVTEAQSKRLLTYERSLQRATKALSDQTTQAAAAGEALKKVGLEAANFEAQSQAISDTVRKVATGLAVVTEAEQVQIRTSKALTAERKTQADVERALEAQRRQNAEDLTRRIQQEAALIAQIERETEKAEKEAAAERALADAFRAAGQEAAAAARSFSALADTTSRIGAGGSAANGVLAILDPTGQARTTLAGLEKQVNDLGQVFTNIKGPIVGYETSMRQLAAAQDAIVKQSRLIDTFQDQQAAVNQAKAAFTLAKDEAERLGVAMSRAEAPSEALATAQRRAKAQLEATGRELGNEQKKLQDLRVALQEAGIASTDLVQAQARLQAAAVTTKAATENLGEGLKKFGRSNQGNALFGLSPYAIQNLGYQINDLFTQVASGTSVLQAFSQQGGQILQIFPGAFSTILRYALPLGAALIVVGSAILAINRNLADARALREYQGTLALMADGATLSAQGLVTLQREITRTGVSFEEAGSLIQEGLRRSLSLDAIQRFAAAARGLVLAIPGSTLADNFKLISDAATRGYPEIVKLQEATGLFTAAQMEQLRAATENGRVLEQQSIIMDAARRAQEAGKIATGAWTEAWVAMKNAVSDLYGWLSNTGPIRIASAALTGLANTLKGISEYISSITRAPTGQEQVTVLERRADQLRAQVQAQQDTPGMARGRRTETVQAELVRTEEQLAVARAALTAATATQTVAQGEATRASERQLAVDNDVVRATLRAAQQTEDLTNQQRVDRARQEAAERARAAGATEAATNESIRIAVEAVERENRARDRQERLDDSARTARIDVANRDRVRRAGEAAVEAAQREDQITSEADLRRFRRRAEDEEIAKIATERRASAAGNAAENRERTTANAISALIAQAGSQETQNLDVRLNAITERFQRVYRALDSFQRQGGTEVGGKPLAQVRAETDALVEQLRQREAIKFYEENINQLVQARQAAYQTINDQQATGAITAAQAVARIREETQRANEPLRESVRLMREFAASIPGAANNPRIQQAIAVATRRAGLTPEGAPDAAVQSRAEQQAAVAGLAERERQVNEILQARQAIVAANTDLVTRGTITQATAQERNQAAYAASQEALQTAISQYQEFADVANRDGMLTANQFQLATARVQQFGAQVALVDPTMVKLRTSIEQAFSTNVLTFFNDFASAIGELNAGTKTWGETLDAIGKAALKMIANILKAVAEAILQQQVLLAVKALTTAVGVAHGGAVIGQSGGMKRNVSPAIFAGAPRYHNGTVVGLKPDEQAAILQKGEEVLASDDPRNIMNAAKRAGTGGSSPMSIRNVLVTDPNMVTDALQSAQGEQVVLTVLRKNAPALRQIVGKQR